MKDAVFLSASVPDPRRDPAFYGTGDVVAIREAVRALAAVVLPRGLLVFGGHPAITPLVLQVGRAVGHVGSVRIYQSRYFERVVPPEARAIPGLVWVDAVDDERDASLLAMRQRMLGAHRWKAAIFIGGMEGVLDEFALVQQLPYTVPCLPVGSTGAAAEQLLGRQRLGMSAQLAASLATDSVYGALFEQLLWPGTGPRP